MSIVLALNSQLYRYFQLLLLALKQPQGKEGRDSEMSGLPGRYGFKAELKGDQRPDK